MNAVLVMKPHKSQNAIFSSALEISLASSGSSSSRQLLVGTLPYEDGEFGFTACAIDGARPWRRRPQAAPLAICASVMISVLSDDVGSGEGDDELATVGRVVGLLGNGPGQNEDRVRRVLGGQT